MVDYDESIDLRPHRMTPKRSEGGESPSVTTIVGYVGEGADEDHVRVYLNRDLSLFVEIATADVVATQQVDAGQADSPRRISLRDDALVRYVRRSEFNGPAGLLGGPLRAKYAARSMLQTKPPWGETEIFFLCPSEIFGLTEATTGTWPCPPGTDVWPQCSDCCI